MNVLNNLDFADKIYYKEKNPYRTLVVKDIKVVFNLKNEDDVASDFEIE